jgi:glycosyltransferase involved in cell wall biosynthesis
MERKKVLILADNPEWIISRCVDHMIRIMSNKYEFIKRYDQQISVDECMLLAKDVDIIHFNSWERLDYFMDIARTYPKKTILTVRSHRYNSGVHRFITLCNALTCVNPDIRRELFRFNNNCWYIPDGIDPVMRDNIRIPVIGLAGHFGDPNDHKGYNLVKQACDELGFYFYPANGSIPPEEMPDYYDSIDAYVCASISEGFSTACMEAMARNIPVISISTGIPANLNVLHVERDVDSIKSGLIALFPSSQTTDYTWENVCNEFDNLYKTI